MKSLYISTHVSCLHGLNKLRRILDFERSRNRDTAELFWEVDFRSSFPVAFLNNSDFIVVGAGFELTTPAS